jgi:hypothetical protein
MMTTSAGIFAALAPLIRRVADTDSNLVGFEPAIPQEPPQHSA